MATKVTYENKEVGPLGSPAEIHNVTSGNLNEIKKAINENADELANKASKVGGLVPVNELPAFYIQGTGTGLTPEDPIVTSGNGNGNTQASPQEWLESLPGYQIGVSKIFYLTAQGGFEWGPIPSGNADKLGAITLVVGNPSVNSIPLSWNGVVDATTYILMRADNALFNGAVQVYAGGATSFSESSLAPGVKYYYRVRASASGFSPSDWSSGSATTLPAGGDVTPATPTGGTVNDTANTFDWINVPGIGNVADYEGTIDYGETYTPIAAKPFVIGNITAAIGQIGVRVKAGEGRTFSGTLFNTTPYTKVLDTPAAPPQLTVDDTADTVDWAYSPGFPLATDYEISLNVDLATPTWNPVFVKPYSVGNVALAVGKVGLRVKAVTGSNNPSAVVKNTVPFTIPIPPGIPVIAWTSVDGLQFTGGNSATAANTSGTFDYAWGYSPIKLLAGGSGYLMFDMMATNAAATAGIVLGLSPNAQRDSDSGMELRMYSIDRNRLMGGKKGQFPIGSEMPISVNSKARFRMDGTNVYTEYSVNNGVSWTILNTTAQPQVDMYPKLFADSIGRQIHNIVQNGFTES